MSNIMISIYKQDVSRMRGYVSCYDNLSKEMASNAIKNFASNYYGEVNIVSLIEVSKNNYMFDVVSLIDELEEKEEKEKEKEENKDYNFCSSEEDSDIKIAIFNEESNRVDGFAYSNCDIDKDEAIEKIKSVLGYFGYDIGMVKLTSISDKKVMFDARTKIEENDNNKRLTKVK